MFFLLFILHLSLAPSTNGIVCPVSTSFLEFNFLDCLYCYKVGLPGTGLLDSYIIYSCTNHCEEPQTDCPQLARDCCCSYSNCTFGSDLELWNSTVKVTTSPTTFSLETSLMETSSFQNGTTFKVSTTEVQFSTKMYENETVISNACSICMIRFLSTIFLLMFTM